MYGSGARIGIVATIIVAARKTIQQDLHLALSVFSVAVAGTTVRGAAVCRFVTTTTQTTGTTISGCAFLYLSINTKIRNCLKQKKSKNIKKRSVAKWA